MDCGLEPRNGRTWIPSFISTLPAGASYPIMVFLCCLVPFWGEGELFTSAVLVIAGDICASHIVRIASGASPVLHQSCEDGHD
jgi:hypothetical protein